MSRVKRRLTAGSLLLFLLAGCAERPPFDILAHPPGAPQYGGRLNVGTWLIGLSAQSWDPVDWRWKSNIDAGLVREQLLAGDLNQSVRKGGPYRFAINAFLPEDAIRGELAESWVWEDSLTVAITLRQVMFPAKPGVMASRLLAADDVVFTFELLRDSPKAIPNYFSHIDSVVARDDRTVVFCFNEYNSEWDYRFGYGYFSGIVPRETAGINRTDWRNVVGTGPFALTGYVHGNSHTYTRKPDYWDQETIDGERYELPFVDEIVYRIIKDESTYLSALRTGKLDVLESIRWLHVDHLKQSTPELQWSRWLGSAPILFLRVDREPLDDLRVRRALNLAVNQREIAAEFYGGHAELVAYPIHPESSAYYQPLDEMPASVQELFSYNPEKARQLLTEAGYPDGFELDVQINSAFASNMELIPLLEDYLLRVGVRINIQPMEAASFFSTVLAKTHAPARLANKGRGNPTVSMRHFVTGQTYNYNMYSDPSYDARMADVYKTRDKADRARLMRAMAVEILDSAASVWLPSPYLYTAWWPWVRNYGGELWVGSVRSGPILTRIWIDNELKRELGF